MVSVPEHDSAATEHAIMQEITLPLATLPDDPVRVAADVDFPVVLRGYDRIAVDAYVRKTVRLVTELQATHSPEAAVRRALERVGEQVAGILQRAHDTAEAITTQSRSEAEDRLQTARREVTQLTASAEDRIKELDLATDRVWAERRRIVADVQKLAEDLGELARSAAERFPPEDTATEPTTEAAPGPGDTAPFDVAADAEPLSVETGTEPVDVAAGIERSDRGLVEVPDDARVIDLMHLGHERVIGCWQVGEVLVDPGPASCLDTLLTALGDWRPRALLLTHVHLDHAGASGSLVALWPDLEVYVHARGAQHLADPSRLVQSARRLYGEDLDRLWGEVLPVPESQLRILHGGEQLEDGFEVAYTPGHASHHVSYLRRGTAFVGDVGGVRITSACPAIPPTPPPDIDIEAWHASLELIREWAPRRLAMTHFGGSDDVQAQLLDVGERLDVWAGLARTSDLESFKASIRAQIAAAVAPELVPTYEQAAPADQLYAGLERYWRKRGERQSPEGGQPETPL